MGRKSPDINFRHPRKLWVCYMLNNNLEQQTQAIFKSWFVDFELNYGIMPSYWKVSQLGSIAKISTEVFSPAKNPNVEVEHYSIPAYDEKRYPVFETSNGIKSNKYRLSSNSVMISKLIPIPKEFGDLTVFPIIRFVQLSLLYMNQ